MSYPVAGSRASDVGEVAPYRAAIAVDVASTDQTLTRPSRGIYIGGAGNLVCRLKDDSADSTWTGLLAGSWYPLAISIVRKTSTTITNSNLTF